jgi:hemoglobin/transferrin/lactoferrin receptor protein
MILSIPRPLSAWIPHPGFCCSSHATSNRRAFTDWTCVSSRTWISGPILNSISPAQGILGLSWQSEDSRWDASLTGTFTQAQDEVDESSGELFKPPGYGVVDFTAGWRYSPSLEVRAGIYNLGDKRYWRWSEVGGLVPAEPALELLTRPGRYWSVSARFIF